MDSDVLKRNSTTEKYTNVLVNRGVEQIIHAATRTGERSSNLSSGDIPITITDHYATCFTTPYQVCSKRQSLQKQRSFLHNEADYSRMLLDLQRQLFSVEYYDGPKVDMKSSKKVLVSAIHSYTTIRTIISRRKKVRWLLLC